MGYDTLQQQKDESWRRKWNKNCENLYEASSKNTLKAQDRAERT